MKPPKQTGDAPCPPTSFDGVEIDFQLTPETEAPSEMHFFFPGERAVNLAEYATHNLHNLRPLRGAAVRDSLAWSKYLDVALHRYGPRRDGVLAQHHWPTAPKAGAQAFTMAWYFTDMNEHWLLVLSNGALNSIRVDQAPKADVSLALTRPTLEALLQQQSLPMQAVGDGRLKIAGNALLLATFFFFFWACWTGLRAAFRWWMRHHGQREKAPGATTGSPKPVQNLASSMNYIFNSKLLNQDVGKVPI